MLLDALFAQLAGTVSMMCAPAHIRNPANTSMSARFWDVGQLGLAMLKDLRQRVCACA